METIRFFKITYEHTEEWAAESVVRAGGRGTRDEIMTIIDLSRFRQRVAEPNAQRHIADMWSHGYRVVAIAYDVPPIC